jgi:hypothetical protein
MHGDSDAESRKHGHGDCRFDSDRHLPAESWSFSRCDFPGDVRFRLQNGLQGDLDDELRGEIQSELLGELFFAALRMTRSGLFNSPNLWMIIPGPQFCVLASAV